jgi:hypothetical protein
MAEHTPTPWVYRPHKHDDWGWIRGQPEDGETVGPIVATARGGSHNATDWDEHRRNKTDPFEPNAAYIVKACNAFPDMLKALTEIDTLATCSGVVDPAQHKNMLDNIYRIARGALAAVKGTSNG